MWIPVLMIAMHIAAHAGFPRHRIIMVYSLSAPAILLQDEWAYETPTGTMQCRWHQGSLDAAEPSLRRFRRTTDILVEYLCFLAKCYITL